jgi:dUTP pyrophosphatase
MSEYTVRCKKLVPHATIPTRGTPYAAGLDLYAAEEVTIQPGEFKAVSTGIAIELPPGYEGQVRARSGNAVKFGVGILNAPGTIDEDYRGEVKVIIINHGKEPFVIRPGDRIAQLVVSQSNLFPAIEVEELSPAPTRGTAGFGSTGR